MSLRSTNNEATSPQASSPQTTMTTDTPPVNPKIVALEEKIAKLEAKLHGRNPEKIVKAHINLLHRYNETKDMTQALISRYAEMTNGTSRAIHEEYGLPLADR